MVKFVIYTFIFFCIRFSVFALHSTTTTSKNSIQSLKNQFPSHFTRMPAAFIYLNRLVLSLIVCANAPHLVRLPFIKPIILSIESQTRRDSLTEYTHKNAIAAFAYACDHPQARLPVHTRSPSVVRFDAVDVGVCVVCARARVVYDIVSCALTRLAR